MTRQGYAEKNPHRAQIRLREARIEAKLTQEFMAAELGIEQATYARLESGLKQVKLHRMEQAASVLGKPLSWFFLTEEEEEDLQVVEEHQAHYALKRQETDALNRRIRHLERQITDMRKSADYQDEIIKNLKEKLKAKK